MEKFNVKKINFSFIKSLQQVMVKATDFGFSVEIPPSCLIPGISFGNSVSVHYEQSFVSQTLQSLNQKEVHSKYFLSAMVVQFLSYLNKSCRVKKKIQGKSYVLTKQPACMCSYSDQQSHINSAVQFKDCLIMCTVYWLLHSWITDVHFLTIV